MRTLITLIITLLVFVGPVAAQSAGDEAAIKELVKQWYALANDHNAEGISEIMIEDSENWSGTRKGTTARLESWAELFRTRFKNVKYKQYEEISLRFITPNVAVYKDRYDFSGLLDEDGNTQPPSKWLNAHIFVKKNGKWLYAELFQRRTSE